MPKALFIRSYLAVVLLILLVGWGLDRLLMVITEKDDKLFVQKSVLQGNFLYIQTQLKTSTDLSNEWSRRQAFVEKKLGYPVSLFQLNDFANNEAIVKMLQAGEIVPLLSEQHQMVYYQLIPESHYVIAMSLLDADTDSVLNEFSLIIIYHLFVIAILFLWLRPLSRDLQVLRSATIGFGDDDFSTRVNIPKSSSIAPVASAFNLMAQRIEDLVLAHKDLTHAVSHELKTPLARFKFSLEIMDNLDDAEKRQHYLQAMKLDVRELDDLIEEMLSYAKFGMHNLKLNTERVDIETWMQAVISQYESNKIKVYLYIDPELSGKKGFFDKHLMTRAINNLIRNGLRYANSLLHVSVEIDQAKLVVSVDDDGIGIPEKDRKQVFQPFTRLDLSRDRESGGSGLGLAIVQKIIQQHDGVVEVDESALGGARFKLIWAVELKMA